MRNNDYLAMEQALTSAITVPQSGIVIGNRIPKEYFVTKGTGESDITHHAGSYHLALKKAGIERANIMTYSSILPSIASKIPKPDHLTHGAVMESIMAVANGERGQRLSAGIIYAWLHDRLSGERYGGLVCEHNGNYSHEQLKENLHASLQELYINGFEEQYVMDEKEVITESFIPVKKYGTALVSLCFVNYFVPVFKDVV